MEEWKIGEIRQVNGEWYQCIEDTECISCINCCFYNGGHKLCTDESMGACVSESRSDKKSTCFKKLEKVGEPFTSRGRLYQPYKLFDIDNVCGYGFWCVQKKKKKTLAIEIEEKKEDMEEKKLNLKPFDIQKAKAGKPVCTRDGRKARIICFDRIDSTGCNLPIVALIQCEETEVLRLYRNDGKRDVKVDLALDLMMLPEKKKGWVNVMEGTAGKVYVGNNIYRTEDEAKEGASRFTSKLIASVPIEWEE